MAVEPPPLLGEALVQAGFDALFRGSEPERLSLDALAAGFDGVPSRQLRTGPPELPEHAARPVRWQRTLSCIRVIAACRRLKSM